jgi:hypothetical protein
MPYSSFNYYLNGELDEVTLWNRALTTSEIRCLSRFGTAPTISGLQLYYKCNQGTPGGINVSQTSLTDETGHTNGSLNNFTLSGPTSNFVSGVTTVNDITAQFCPGSTYTFGLQTLSAPGIYSQAFPTITGCDSTVRLSLSYTDLNDSVVLNGSTLTALGTGYSFQWVDCQNGYQPITGETQSYFSPSQNGDYAVIVNDGSCSDTSQCLSVSTAGIAPVALASVRVYPNPVSERLIVELPVSLDKVSIEVTDALGRVVLRETVSGTRFELRADNWSSGIYTLSLRSSEGSFVTTVTK